MRVPHFQRVVAVLAALALPFAAAAQSLATMPLSTASPEAAAAFREGVTDLLLIYPVGAARHFRAAVDKDPAFALARAYLANADGRLTHAQQVAEVERAMVDATKASAAELALVLQVREQVNGRASEDWAIRRAAKALLPDEAAFYTADLGPAAAPKDQVARWREATTKFPESAFALNAYAYALWGAGERKAALDAARRQVERFGKYANPHDTYAELLAWSGDLEGAATHYAHAVAAAPDYTEGYVGLAEVAAMRLDLTRARAELQRAIERTPDVDARIGYMRQVAATYALETNRDAVFDALTRVVDAATAHGDTAIMALVTAQLAALEARRGNADAAHTLGARASALRPHAQGVYYFTAMSHALLGHEAPARAAIAAARAAPGANASPAKDRLIAVEGYIHIKGERPREALTVLQKADTTDLVVLSWIAEANAMIGNKARSTAQFTRIRDDRRLNLLDYAAANARARAATALAPRAATRE